MTRQHKSEQGQTLVETVVAVFILTMGIVAALGLANFAVGASSNIVKQIIGMGIAREGVEAVKNMRDTNWLKDTLASDCYDYVAATETAACYKNWLNASGGYSIDPPAGPAGQTFVLGINQANPLYWELQASSGNYTLNYDTTGTNGFYTPNAGTPSGYFRRITITEEATGVFSQATIGPRLLVSSEVWWNDKKCPTASSSTPPTTGACRIKLELFLTNWKNY
jgi:Tfp pilus assembly protein PilV